MTVEIARQHYTSEVLQQVQAMIEDGATNEAIAETLGTTPKRLASRLSQLGIRREGFHNGVTRAVRMPTWLIQKCAVEARARDMRVAHLIVRVLDEVATNNLFSAILGDGK